MGSMNTPRRGIPGWLLVLLLVVMPLIELFVLIRIGRTIGAGWTIVALIAAAIVGAWVVKREGARAWTAFTTALSEGKMPARELADGVLILAGGLMMMAPGVVSDVIGLLLVLPFTRPVFRPAVMALVGKRLHAIDPLGGMSPGAPFGFGPGAPSTDPRFDNHAGFRDARRPGHQDEGPVVRGEVVDD